MAINSCHRRGIGANAVGAFRQRIRQKMWKLKTRPIGPFNRTIMIDKSV
jgi:hypothetical protein